MIRKAVNATMLVVILFSPLLAFAAPSDILGPAENLRLFLPGNVGGQSPTVGGTILGIIRIILALVGLIAVAMLIWGGFRYVTSAGSDDVVKSAKKTIFNALIGLIIVILSFVIVTIVTNLAFGRVTN